MAGEPGYLLVQEWTVLLLSLVLAAVRKFMVTELQWLTLQRVNQNSFKLWGLPYNHSVQFMAPKWQLVLW